MPTKNFVTFMWLKTKNSYLWKALLFPKKLGASRLDFIWLLTSAKVVGIFSELLDTKCISPSLSTLELLPAILNESRTCLCLNLLSLLVNEEVECDSRLPIIWIMVTRKTIDFLIFCKILLESVFLKDCFFCPFFCTQFTHLRPEKFSGHFEKRFSK